MIQRTLFPHSLAELESLNPKPDPRAWARPGPKRSLGIGLTSSCNFACPTCWYHAPEGEGVRRPPGEGMPLETLEAILNAAGPLAMVNCSLEGEPFLHPRLFDCLGAAGDHADETVLCTNASLVRREDARRLASLGISRVELSIDGADGRTYAFMRRGGTLEGFMRSARLLADELGEAVELYGVCCRENLASLEHLPELARRCGIGKAAFGLLRMHGLPHREGLSLPSPLVLRSFLRRVAACADRCRVRLSFGGFFCDSQTADMLEGLLGPGHVPPQRAARPCTLPWMHASVLSDLRLLPCCGEFKPEPIQEISFDGIFNHRYMVLLRSLLLERRTVPACGDCWPEP